MNTPDTPAPCYRIVRGRDSRFCQWFDVETVAADGARAIVATLDTMDEARDLVRILEWHAHRRAQEKLTDARWIAGRLQAVRRAVFQRHGLGFWTAANTGGHGADRAAAAGDIRAARAALRNF